MLDYHFRDCIWRDLSYFDYFDNILVIIQLINCTYIRVYDKTLLTVLSYVLYSVYCTVHSVHVQEQYSFCTYS